MRGEIFLSFQSGHKEMQHLFQTNFSSKSSIVFSFPSLITHITRQTVQHSWVLITHQALAGRVIDPYVMSCLTQPRNE